MTDPETVLSALNPDLPDGYTLRLSADDRWIVIEAVTPTGTRRLAWTEPVAFLHGLRTAQGELIEHELGQAWPRCPAHGSHPLSPKAEGWLCPAGVGGPWAFGAVNSVPVTPEPERADGEVRWWLDDLAWGVVADHEGDVFVHFSVIEGTGYRSLTEGERVGIEVGTARQGMFRQAEQVWREEASPSHGLEAS